MASPNPEKLHIFVNGIKFDSDQGVKPQMTGAEIAALVHVPTDLAVVRRETGPDQGEIDLNLPIEVHQGARFTVTRRVVQGGAPS